MNVAKGYAKIILVSEFYMDAGSGGEGILSTQALGDEAKRTPPTP